MQLDPVQANAVRIMLNSFGAKDIKEYQKNGPKNEALLLYFTFESRKETKIFQDFIYDRNKYQSKGIYSNLFVYLLKTGKSK